jgi:hypothetical protein
MPNVDNPSQLEWKRAYPAHAHLYTASIHGGAYHILRATKGDRFFITFEDSQNTQTLLNEHATTLAEAKAIAQKYCDVRLRRAE